MATTIYSRQAGNRGVFIAYVFFLLLLLPFILLIQTTAVYFHLSIIPVAFIIIYSAAWLSIISTAKNPQILTTTFWIFVYIFLGICPFLQITTENFPWGDRFQSFGDMLLLKAAFTVLLGLFGFDIGRHLIRSNISVSTPQFLKRRVNYRIIIILGILFIPFTYLYLKSTGEINYLFTARQERFEYLSKFQSSDILLYSAIITTPIYVASVAMLAKWLMNNKNKMKVGIVWKLFTMLLILITLAINNPISTPRLKVGTILLSFLFVVPWRKSFHVLTIAGLVTGLILVFPFTDIFRYSVETDLSARISQTNAIEELTEKGDFDAFMMIANTIYINDVEGFQMGRQMLGTLLFWVPRPVWPDKPIPTSMWVAGNKGYKIINLSEPLWAEFYVDGGWFLVFFALILYGFAVRILDQWYARTSNLNRIQVVSILVPIYAGYQFFLLRGSLMPAVAYFSPIFLYVYISGLAFRLKNK